MGDKILAFDGLASGNQLFVNNKIAAINNDCYNEMMLPMAIQCLPSLFFHTKKTKYIYI
jgi:hypothetical protein